MKKIDFAEKYVLLLSKSFNDGWLKTYKGMVFEDNVIIQKITLLHPNHYKELAKLTNLNSLGISARQFSIQGKRTFPEIREKTRCASKLFWGYDCPFSDIQMVSDHAFPYSMGGPTNNSHNKRILCKWHNMIKANDIHNYPWEALFKEYKYYENNNLIHWIDEQLNKIIKEFNVKI